MKPAVLLSSSGESRRIVDDHWLPMSYYSRQETFSFVLKNSGERVVGDLHNYLAGGLSQLDGVTRSDL